ncbi:phage integrase family protein [Burkholderia thailandensis H0587]|nr:phage integrase family protein [Burkholderia thailandensis H0587]AOJ49516.1 hypothetical protein AQ475_00790 [Burkholderia thailandensis]
MSITRLVERPYRVSIGESDDDGLQTNRIPWLACAAGETVRLVAPASDTVETKSATVMATSVTLDSEQTTCAGALLAKGALAFESGMTGAGSAAGGNVTRISSAADFRATCARWARACVYKDPPIRQTTLEAWRKVLKRAHIKDFRWRDLRHTWAGWHVQRGMPLQVLKEFGGWKTMEMV